MFSHIPKSEPPVLIGLTTKSVKKVMFEPPAAVDLVLCFQGRSLADGPWTSTDGPCSQNGSSTDGPLSSADGRSSTDGRSFPNESCQDGPEPSTDGHGLLWMARVLPSSCPRMAGEPDLKQEGGDVRLYIKMGARAASSRSSTNGPQVVRGWPNRCTYRR